MLPGCSDTMRGMNKQFTMIGVLAAAIVVAAVIVAMRPQPEQSASVSPDEIQGIVEQYLLENPEVLIASLNAYRAREEEASQAMVSETIKSLVASIDQQSHMPIAGNPDGDITIVEFFDYRCGFCKRVHPTVKQVMAGDSNIRLVYAEFPILGDQSMFASRAATAVWLNWPDKYATYHDILMSSRGQLDETVVFGSALELGIELSDLEAAMNAPDVAAAISANHELAARLQINGTPAFIIGDQLVPGAIGPEEFATLINQYRGG